MANTTDDTNKNTNDEDNFGLPNMEFKPLDQLDKTSAVEDPAEEESSAREAEETNYDEEEGGSKAPMVIAVIIGLVVIVAGFLIYQFVYKPKQEKARLEQLAKIEADKKVEADRQAQLAEAERMKREAEAAANAKPAEGAIETLTNRTGHYFVIVASAIDGDLIMDQAKRLSAKGTGSKIIPPFGKWKFYRLGIGDYDSFASAQSSADAAKAEYGITLWVMKF